MCTTCGEAVLIGLGGCACSRAAARKADEERMVETMRKVAETVENMSEEEKDRLLEAADLFPSTLEGKPIEDLMSKDDQEESGGEEAPKTAMGLDEYQKISSRTMYGEDTPIELRHAVYGLGLAAEAGEVADEIKKRIGHGHGREGFDLAKELGDVLWYVAAVATEHDLSLTDIAQANIDKLLKRYPDGFNTEDSKRRRDVEDE